MPKKILCATDGSHVSQKAVEFACRFAKEQQEGASLVFATVDSLAQSDLDEDVPFSWDSRLVDAAEEEVARQLKAAESVAKQQDVEASYVLLRGPNTVAAIIGYAEKEGIDHIVTGSIGRTGVSRLLLGSVAWEVVTKAHCPVTIVR